MEIMGSEVFDSAPALERSHRVGKKPEHPRHSPRPFVVCFQRFQEKEHVLRWARRHELKYKNSTLRIYQDFSVSLSRRRAEFNDIKQALYKKGIKFQLLYPACLLVSFGGNTLKFDTRRSTIDKWWIKSNPTDCFMLWTCLEAATALAVSWRLAHLR